MQVAPIRAVMPVQIVAVLVGFGVLMLFPAAHGRLWLVPVSRAGRASLVRLATAHGARLLASGPGGSMVVMGDRALLWRRLLGAGVVTLAAPPGACGGGGPGSGT